MERRRSSRRYLLEQSRHFEGLNAWDPGVDDVIRYCTAAPHLPHVAYSHTPPSLPPNPCARGLIIACRRPPSTAPLVNTTARQTHPPIPPKTPNPPTLLWPQVTSFLGAGARQFGFMVRGLRELQPRLEARGISFFLLQGDPAQTLPDLVQRLGAGLLVTDYSPLRLGRQWREQVRVYVREEGG